MPRDCCGMPHIEIVYVPVYRPPYHKYRTRSNRTSLMIRICRWQSTSAQVRLSRGLLSSSTHFAISNCIRSAYLQPFFNIDPAIICNPQQAFTGYEGRAPLYRVSRQRVI